MVFQIIYFLIVFPCSSMLTYSLNWILWTWRRTFLIEMSTKGLVVVKGSETRFYNLQYVDYSYCLFRMDLKLLSLACDQEFVFHIESYVHISYIFAKTLRDSWVGKKNSSSYACGVIQMFLECSIVALLCCSGTFFF